MAFPIFLPGPPATPNGGWGKLNAGQPWLPFCYNVGRALSRARLGEYEHAVIWYVLERSWGDANRTKGRGDAWPDAIPVQWLLRPIAAELRLSEKRVSEAKCGLVKSLMLFDCRGWLLINKQADEWVWPVGHAQAGDHRLSREAIEYALEGNSARSNPGKLGLVSRNSGIAVPEYRDEIPGISGLPSRNIGNPIPEFRDRHIEERASEEFQKMEEDGRKEEASVLPDSLSAEKPKPRFEVDGCLPGDEVPDEALLEAMRALIGARFNPATNNGQLWSKVRFHRHVWPTTWLLKALKRACVKNNKPALPPSWAFLQTILREWQALKVPDAGPEDDYDDRLVMIPPAPQAPEFFPEFAPKGWVCPTPPKREVRLDLSERTKISLPFGSASPRVLAALSARVIKDEHAKESA